MRLRIVFGACSSLVVASLVGCVGDSATVSPPVDGGTNPDTSTPADTSVADTSDASKAAFYVSPTTGADTNPGTHASPFKTVKHAASVATSGYQIVLLDGTYNAASGETWGTSIADGVSVVAQNPGKAVLVGTTNDAIGLDFAGSGAASDLVMQGFATSLNSAVAKATVTWTNVSCSGGNVCVSGSNGSKLTLVNVSVSGAWFGGLFSGAGTTAAWTGGTITGLVKATGLLPSSGLAVQDAVVVADTLTMTNNGYAAVIVTGAGDVTLKNCNITKSQAINQSGFAIALLQNGTEKLTLDGTTLDNTGVAGQVTGVLTNVGSAVNVKNGAIRNFSNYGISMSGGAVAADGTTVTANAGGGVSMNGGSFQGNNMTITSNAFGIYFQNASLTLRGTTVSNNAGSGISGAGTPTLDLGTTNTPGKNTIQNMPGPGLDVSLFPQQNGYFAIGNTWNANIQGADGQGHFLTPNTSILNSTGSNFKVGPNAKIYVGP